MKESMGMQDKRFIAASSICIRIQGKLIVLARGGNEIELIHVHVERRFVALNCYIPRAFFRT